LQQLFLTINKSNLSGLILCGGAARRLGGEDKGLMKARGEPNKAFQNKPLIEHQIAFLRPQVSAISISANRNLPIYQSYGYPVNQDATGVQFDGPLQGILKGLSECQTDWLYVQPIDTPNLPTDTIEQMIKEVELSHKQAFYLVTNERAHYLNLLLHVSCLKSLENFVNRGEKRVKTYLEEIKAQTINLGWNENIFRNLNEPEDYQLSSKSIPD